MWILYLVLSLVCLGFFCARLGKLRNGEVRKDENIKETIVVLVLFFLWATFAILFMWITRPWWQPLWFQVFYLRPTFWVGTLIIAAVISLIYVARRNVRKEREVKNSWSSRPRITTDRRTGSYVWTGIAIWFVLLIVLVIFSPSITKVKIYQTIAPAVQQITDLPETSQVRFLPMEVAHRYAENKIQESEVKIGDIDPIFFEDEFSWVAARIPNGFWRSCSYQADGFALVRSDGSVEMVHQPMTYGEGMIVLDDVKWKLREKKYWADIPEIYYLLDEGKVVGIAPYISFRYQFPVMVPYWGGVIVFHSDGEIEDLTPTEAQALPYTKGQPLFPEKLARQYVDSWAYKNGIINAWFTHRDQVEIPHIDYTANQMPFLLPTSEGPEWMVATTPRGGKGIFKIFLIDAHSGMVQLYEPPKESTWIGPNTIWDYIKTALPMYNWYRGTDEGSTGNILAIEPRPVYKDGKLYWMASITNTEYGGVSETVLVDSQKPDRIISFKTETEVKAFLFGNETPTEPGETISPEAQRILAIIDQIIDQLTKMKNELENPPGSSNST